MYITGSSKKWAPNKHQNGSFHTLTTPRENSNEIQRDREREMRDRERERNTERQRE